MKTTLWVVIPSDRGISSDIMIWIDEEKPTYMS